MGEMKNSYKTSVRKPEEMRSLGRPRHRLKDDIRVDLQEEGERCGLDKFGLEEGPVMGSCEYSNKPSDSIQGREFLN